jgi:hypothetical protein
MWHSATGAGYAPAPMATKSTSRRARAGLALLSLALAAGCGTALYQTPVPYSGSLLPRLGQAAASLGCHERSSERFELFLFCPGPKHALAITQAEGKLLISCPELGRLRCKKLFERVRNASLTTPGSTPARATPPEP